MEHKLEKFNLEVPIKSKEFLYAAYRKEKIIIKDETSECYFILNDVASKIWGLIGKGNNVQSIIKELVNEYEIDRSTCEEQVIQFMTQLEDKEWIYMNQ